MFQNGASVLDIGILTGIAVIVMILLATMEQRRRVRSAAARKARRPPPLSPLGNNSSLSPDDERILGRLGWLLKNPRNRHRLLQDKATFLKAARRAHREGIATERELVALARRAGFPVDSIAGTGMSTLKLAAGVEVSVADPAMNSGAGSIATVHPETLRIRLRRGQTAFAPGTTLDVVCATNQGLCRFRTNVRGSAGKTLHLEHTNEIEEVQRRAHRRHDLEVPVVVASGGVSHRSRTVDLSIGGAAVRNPHRAFAAEVPVSLTLSTEHGELKVPGEVVRTSRGGRLLHVRFRDMSESVRHRLFRAIMGAGKKR